MIHKCSGHTARPRTLAFSSDGVLVSGGIDKQVIVWKTSEGDKLADKKTFPDSHQGEVTQVGWLDSESVISCGDDGVVRIFKA